MVRKPILVSGAHRSGSTWVGKVVSEAQNTHYVHEPFNLSMTVYDSPIKYWFEFVSEKTEYNRQQEILTYLRSFYDVSFVNTFKANRNKNITRRLYRSFLNARTTKKSRIILKDPLALMAAPWIYKTLSCDVVITIRHPAAFVASLKLKDWKFPFDHLLKQPELVDLYLLDFKDEIAFFTKNEGSIIEQGSLLWNIIYLVVIQFQKKYQTEWYFVRHEDLSKNPLEAFQELFQFLQLEYSEKVKQKIIDSTSKSEATTLERDSKANISTWTERLALSEINYVKEYTQQVWKHFYKQEDWFGF